MVHDNVEVFRSKYATKFSENRSETPSGVSEERHNATQQPPQITSKAKALTLRNLTISKSVAYSKNTKLSEKHFLNELGELYAVFGKELSPYVDKLVSALLSKEVSTDAVYVMLCALNKAKLLEMLMQGRNTVYHNFQLCCVARQLELITLAEFRSEVASMLDNAVEKDFQSVIKIKTRCNASKVFLEMCEDAKEKQEAIHHELSNLLEAKGLSSKYGSFNDYYIAMSVAPKGKIKHNELDSVLPDVNKLLNLPVRKRLQTKQAIAFAYRILKADNKETVATLFAKMVSMSNNESLLIDIALRLNFDAYVSLNSCETAVCNKVARLKGARESVNEVIYRSLLEKPLRSTLLQEVTGVPKLTLFDKVFTSKKDIADLVSPDLGIVILFYLAKKNEPSKSTYKSRGGNLALIPEEAITQAPLTSETKENKKNSDDVKNIKQKRQYNRRTTNAIINENEKVLGTVGVANPMQNVLQIRKELTALHDEKHADTSVFRYGRRRVTVTEELAKTTEKKDISNQAQIRALFATNRFIPVSGILHKLDNIEISRYFSVVTATVFDQLSKNLEIPNAISTPNKQIVMQSYNMHAPSAAINVSHIVSSPEKRIFMHSLNVTGAVAGMSKKEVVSLMLMTMVRSYPDRVETMFISKDLVGMLGII